MNLFSFIFYLTVSVNGKLSNNTPFTIELKYVRYNQKPCPGQSQRPIVSIDYNGSSKSILNGDREYDYPKNFRGDFFKFNPIYPTFKLFLSDQGHRCWGLFGCGYTNYGYQIIHIEQYLNKGIINISGFRYNDEFTADVGIVIRN